MIKITLKKIPIISIQKSSLTLGSPFLSTFLLKTTWQPASDQPLSIKKNGGTL